MSTKIQRAYGKEFTISDIIFNKKENTVYFILNSGFFGIQKIILIKNDTGSYDMKKTYVGKDGQNGIVNIGKTFEVTNKEGKVIVGMTRGTFALSSKWDKEKQKEVFDNKNALYFTTHKLKEPQEINDNIIKVGFVTGQFGIEIEEVNNTQTNSAEPVVETIDEPVVEPVVETVAETQSPTKVADILPPADDDMPF